MLRKEKEMKKGHRLERKRDTKILFAFAAVLEQTQGETFFNFDDQAFSDPIARFLRERHPKQ
jgi:hypothetical protein